MAHSTPSALYFPTEPSGIGSLAMLYYDTFTALLDQTGIVRVLQYWKNCIFKLRCCVLLFYFILYMYCYVSAWHCTTLHKNAFDSDWEDTYHYSFVRFRIAWLST